MGQPNESRKLSHFHSVQWWHTWTRTTQLRQERCVRAWACPAAVSRLHVSAAACECSCDVGEQVKALPFLSASPALPRPSFPLRFNPNSSLFISPISPAPLPFPSSLSQNVSPCPHWTRPLPRPSHLRYCLPPYCRRRHRRCSKLRVFLKNWIRGDWRSADAEHRGAGPAPVTGLNQTKQTKQNQNQNKAIMRTRITSHLAPPPPRRLMSLPLTARTF